MAKPVVLFFARGYQSDYFPTLASERYDSLFVTLTKAERLRVEQRGGRVVGCFEEDYARIDARPVPESYLQTSFVADRFLGRYPYEKRREILGREIGFWSRILDTHRPAAAVNELVAIEISEVLLLECRARGVPYLAGMNCLVDGFFYWLRNPLSLSGRYLTAPPPGPEAAAHAREYVRELLGRDYKPFYVKNLRGRWNAVPFAVACVRLALWKLRRWSSDLTGRFRYELYDDEYLKRVAVFFKGLALRYDRIADLPTGKEIIYYPLHQEPEATLNYMSEFYSNQVATIENILKCLSVDQVLVVKEHPVDKGSLLRAKFRALRRGATGLYYFPAELHGREVLAHVHRVVTLTSTVGWEAAVLGKTVYVLGQIFYDEFKAVTALTGFNELKRALRAPARANAANAAEVEAFVACMVEQSQPGNPFPHSALYGEPNRRHVTDAIARSLAHPEQG